MAAQILKTESTALLHLASETLATTGTTSLTSNMASAARLAVREAAVGAGEVGVGVGRGVVTEGLAAGRAGIAKEFGSVAGEGLAGESSALSQHLQILKSVHSPTQPTASTSTLTTTLLDTSTHAHLPINANMTLGATSAAAESVAGEGSISIKILNKLHHPPSTSLRPRTVRNLSAAATSSSSAAADAATSIRESISNALQSGLEEQVDRVADTTKITHGLELSIAGNAGILGEGLGEVLAERVGGAGEGLLGEIGVGREEIVGVLREIEGRVGELQVEGAI